MKKEKLYIEFENLAEKLGLRVIKGKGDFQGGSCIIKDEKVIEKSKSLTTNNWFTSSHYGFGKYQNSGSETNIVVREIYNNPNDPTDSVISSSSGNELNITGQFRIFNNTYQELVRSNYFSNL